MPEPLQVGQVLAQQIIQSREGEKNVAAYDVVAEALEAQGDPQAAMWVLRDAATIVPSARRQRVAGESAYRNGDLDTAKTMLQKATKATRGSVVAQVQDTLLLAQAMVDLGESADAVKVLKDATPANQTNPTFANVALAIQAQAEAKAGRPEDARKLLDKARSTMRSGRADFASVALAKAELMSGNVEAGLELLSSAISADHENPRIKQMVTNTLRETGHEDKVVDIVEGGTALLENKVRDARKLFRDSQIDDAVRAIENAVQTYPENTGVLLQAAQLNCMALRLKKAHNTEMIDRVQLYLTRLEKLMPANDRVVMMRRYFRETMNALEALPAQI